MTMPVTEAITRYASAAEAYGRAIKNGQATESDKHFDAVEEAFAKLKAHGNNGLRAIAELLESKDDGVKLWSAAHLLNYPEFGSLEVLERLKRSRSILALTAEVTLDQWRNGKLTY